MSFAVSIAILSLVQGALVAAPRAPLPPLPLDRLRSRWWALVPPLSIAVVIAAVALDSGSARALSWLALVAVPPLAAVALAALVRGSRPVWALAVPPLLALAWADQGALPGEAAATALSGLCCVALGWMLVSLVAASWLRLGVYAMAAVDAWLVGTDLLQGPNAVLSRAEPAAGLPQLQAVHFGGAAMGCGDLFVAALVGCLLAGRRQLAAAALVATLALAFDLLVFAVDELPTTVPVAVGLALAQRRLSCSGPTS